MGSDKSIAAQVPRVPRWTTGVGGVEGGGAGGSEMLAIELTMDAQRKPSDIRG